MEERVAGGEAGERGLLLERRAARSRGSSRSWHERGDGESGGEVVALLCSDRLEERAGAEGKAHGHGCGVLAVHCASVVKGEADEKTLLSLSLFRQGEREN